MHLVRIVTLRDEIIEEGGRALARPLTKVAVGAILKNPFAGRYVDDLSELFDAGEQLGRLLGEKALALLGGPAHSFGKAAIVGTDGELEHAAALMHPRLGIPLRDVLGGGKAIIPSAKKVGAPGTPIDVPLHYKDAMKVRTHFDAMEFRVADAPRPDELVCIIALTDGGRPHPRVGGLELHDVKGEDGLV